MGRPLKFERAPLYRRGLAAGLDAVPAIGVAFAAGLVVQHSSYIPPPKWFWSEWWLKLWLDHPNQIIVPIVTLVLTWLIWNLMWEGFTSRTLGGRVAQLSVIDRRGIPIGWAGAVRRMVGGILNVLTLGLGAAWSAIDPDGRALHDYVGGTWVVQDN